MTEEKVPSKENWDDFAGEYLKAEYIKEFPLEIVIKDVETYYDDTKPRIVLITEYNGRDWKFELNKTNQNFIKSEGITGPNAAIGKKLTLNKIKARNPTTNTLVDSIIIVKVE